MLDRAVFSYRDFNDVLHQRRMQSPEGIAFTFLDEHANPTGNLTYTELLGHAQQMARQLQATCRRGDRILIVQGQGFAFIRSFFGCLHGGFVAVPVCPPSATTPESLAPVRAVATDANASVVLVHPKWYARFQPSIERDPVLSRLTWIVVGEPEPQASLADVDSSWTGDAMDRFPAVLQYTSGSTAAPKGVAISHANLLHNSEQIFRRFGHAESSRGLIWLPPYHDMGLVGGILQPVFGGFPVDLIPPVAIIKRPHIWLKAISQRSATTSGGPSFAYRMVLEKTSEEQLADLDLSSWTVAFNGAEPVDLDLLERFTQRFEPRGFRRSSWFVCYGLAESTLMVTGPDASCFPLAARPSAGVSDGSDGDHVVDTKLQSVGCGIPVDDLDVAVVSVDNQARCEDGAIGEIWVRGPSVSAGYWSRDENRAIPFGGMLDSNGPYLRTGDLGFFEGRELFVCGRISTLLLIRGKNFQANEIERVAESSSPSLEPGGSAAIQVEDSGGESRLVLALEVRRTALRNIDAAGVREAVTEKVAATFGVRAAEVVLTGPGTIPRTTSGKIRRSEARRAFLEGKLEAIPLQREKDHLLSPQVSVAVDETERVPT